MRPDAVCQDPVQAPFQQDERDTGSADVKREVTFAARGTYRKNRTAGPIKVLLFFMRVKF
jgi:hypothetical protein